MMSPVWLSAIIQIGDTREDGFVEANRVSNLTMQMVSG